MIQICRREGGLQWNNDNDNCNDKVSHTTHVTGMEFEFFVVDSVFWRHNNDNNTILFAGGSDKKSYYW